MTATNEWTVGRLLEWTTDYLSQHDADTPRLDAEILLAKARGCRRIELYTAFNDLADDLLRDTFRQLVRQRAEGVPVAYLVGEREFYSLPFYVTPDVLIPRPESEFLVIEVLDLCRERSATAPFAPRILDLGTGSGCLAVSLAVHLPDAEIVAVDLSDAALEVARRNVERNGVAERITLRQGDLYSTLDHDEQFDVIVTNPPYVTEEEYQELDREVRDHEPRMALVAGPLGIEVLQRIAEGAPNRISPGGWLLSEISPMICDLAVETVAAVPELDDVQVTKDLRQLPRIVMARRSCT